MICVDSDPINQDWPKFMAWDFFPYKSKKFFEYNYCEEQLPYFRTTMAYKAAVQMGWIENDEWTGTCTKHW